MNIKFNKYFTIIFFTLIFNFNSGAQSVKDHRIAVIVNDQIITSYDVVQRMKINAILAGVNITSENNEQLANVVVEELIQEKLKKEKSIEYEISISDQEYLQFEESYYNKRGFSKDDLLDVFEANKIDYKVFKNYLTIEISWQKLIAGMYYRLTSASNIEIEEIISKNPEILEDQAKDIVIQRQLDLKGTKLLRDLLNESTIEYK